MTRTVEANGLTFSIAAAGRRSAHRLLFVHGFTGAKEDFTEWLHPVAERGWEAVAVDLRGHGASDKPAGLNAYGLEQMGFDVVAVADALGWDRFTIVGHSMGGMVAQHVALAQPHRLTGLVLMNTSHGPIEGVERELADLACAVVAAGGLPALIEATARLQEARPLETAAQLRVLAERPGHAEFNTRKLLAVAPDAYRALAVEMFEQADRLDRLRTLSIPVLVLVGAEDKPFVGPCERIAAAMPDAVLEVLPDAGHSPQFEDPERWWKAVVRFLDRLEGVS